MIGLTVGQQVVIDNDHKGTGRYVVGTVTKVSDTRITVNVGGKMRQFNRRNGAEIGYGNAYIVRPRIATKGDRLMTVEEADDLEKSAALKAEKMALIRKIQQASPLAFLDFSLEELQALADRVAK